MLKFALPNASPTLADLHSPSGKDGDAAALALVAAIGGTTPLVLEFGTSAAIIVDCSAIILVG